LLVACISEIGSGWRRHSAARARRADTGIVETMSRRRNAAPAVEGKPGAADFADTGH
jgi:hypothetical protein